MLSAIDAMHIARAASNIALQRPRKGRHHPGLAAFRVQGLVVRLPETILGYVGVSDFWVPANRLQIQSAKVTTQAEQQALWKRLTGK